MRLRTFMHHVLAVEHRASCNFACAKELYASESLPCQVSNFNWSPPPPPPPPPPRRVEDTTVSVGGRTNTKLKTKLSM
jgi:hypothetical protein